MLCISNRNNTQEPDSEQETEGQEQSQINKSRKTRVTQRVQSEKEITREKITSAPIPETSQNIIFSSHKIADMSGTHEHTGLRTAGCWLARRLHQLKASTTMDLGISILLIFVRCVALKNLDLLIKTGWNVFVRLVAENAGRG